MNQELLDRLQKADPDLWKRYDDTDLSSDELPFYACTVVDELKDAWLQACIQGAIRARGWDLYQCNHHAADPHCRANIWVSDVRHDGKGDTEAEALLKAYLAVIEAAK